ncbi:unnamed protein product, partial [Polarella glacialis]
MGRQLRASLLLQCLFTSFEITLAQLDAAFVRSVLGQDQLQDASGLGLLQMKADRAAVTSSLPDPAKIIEPTKLFFMTHYKTGTMLARGLMMAMAKVLGENATSYGRADDHCAPTYLANYECMHEPTWSNINKECPDFRAVHLIREAGAVTVSGYLYQLKQESLFDLDLLPGVWPWELRAASLREGLGMEARSQASYNLPEIAEIYKLTHSDPNVITVDLAEFDKDFASTTQRIFEFLLGSTHPSLE